MTGTRTTTPTTSRPIEPDPGWTAHPVALLIAAVGMSALVALIISAGGSDPTPAVGGSGPPAVQETEAPGPAPVPLTADRIAADPNAVGTPVGARAATTVDVELSTVEVQGQLADGTVYDYWTFDGQVPGPMIRVRVGDTVNLTLSNAASSTNIHSIDLHAVTGPGGGAKALQVPPGEDGSITFQALNPGVYVYHCATPHIPTHIANGMYGLIVVEPEGGLSPVDREFYVVQGEVYTAQDRGTVGRLDYSFDGLLNELPTHVVFNGQVAALTGEHAMTAQVGERIRMFVGNGGPNLVSSFHVIGEIFDVVHDEGASEVKTNVQTTLVPAGGATWVEFTVDVPGDYILVDHAITRAIDKGAVAILTVTGPEDASIFDASGAYVPPERPVTTTPDGGTYAPGDTIPVSMTEFAFAPESLVLPAGTYTFRIVNDGVAPHQFAIGEASGHGVHEADSGTLEAGAVKELQVTLEPGSYHIACHIPGHLEAGMETSLTVTG